MDTLYDLSENICVRAIHICVVHTQTCVTFEQALRFGSYVNEACFVATQPFLDCSDTLIFRCWRSTDTEVDANVTIFKQETHNY